MVLLDDLSQRLQLDDPEERRIIANVTWSQYEALLAETFQVHEIQIVFVRAARHAALTKTTAFYSNAKRCSNQ